MILAHYLVWVYSLITLPSLFLFSSNITLPEQRQPITEGQNPVKQILSQSETDIFELMKQESIGKLKIEMREDEVISILGKPECQSKKQFSQVDAFYHQDWNYPSKGISLQMASETEDSLSQVQIIQIKFPSKLTTSREIMIGDSYYEVEQKYGKFQNTEESKPTTFVVGSVYGGLVFSFQDQKVTKIYLGYLAD